MRPCSPAGRVAGARSGRARPGRGHARRRQHGRRTRRWRDGSGCTRATSRARSSGFRAAGPFAGDREEATERTALLALLQPIEADTLPRAGARRCWRWRGRHRAAVRGPLAARRRLPSGKGGAEIRLLAGRLERGERQGRGCGAAAQGGRGARQPRAPRPRRSWRWAAPPRSIGPGRGRRPARASHPDLSGQRARSPGPARGWTRRAARCPRHEPARLSATRGSRRGRAAVPRVLPLAARLGCRRRRGCSSRWTSTDRPPQGLRAGLPRAGAGRRGRVVPQLSQRLVPPARRCRDRARRGAQRRSRPSRSTTAR